MRRAGDGGEPFRITVSEHPPPVRMMLHGEFDIRCADAATHALEELLGRRPDTVVIDLTGLEFIDSTGVKFLVEGLDKAHALGIKLSLVHGAEPVRRVLTVTGVTALFEDPQQHRPE
jgi:anti-sigma B factor antagonist